MRPSALRVHIDPASSNLQESTTRHNRIDYLPILLRPFVLKWAQAKSSLHRKSHHDAAFIKTRPAWAKLSTGREVSDSLICLGREATNPL